MYKICLPWFLYLYLCYYGFTGAWQWSSWRQPVWGPPVTADSNNGFTQTNSESDSGVAKFSASPLLFGVPLFLLIKFFFPFQSLKRKPGQADSERSIGDYNKPVNKRLRTVERSKESLENNRQSDTQQVSDLYEHIKHGDQNYDTQTYGRWSPGSWVCDGLAGV